MLFHATVTACTLSAATLRAKRAIAHSSVPQLIVPRSRRPNGGCIQLGRAYTPCPATFAADKSAATAGQAQVNVYTMDGNIYPVTITPGTTTTSAIRAEVAARMGVPVSEVRLAYAGKELPPAKDDMILKINPNFGVMHALQRMEGG